jgi:CheY-like chemotaxis protein
VIRLAKEQAPSAILLDINMPEKDGFEVLQEISEDWGTYQALKTTPIIILSNYSNPQDIEYCMKMGAQDYIVKAEWTPERIVNKIKQYLADLEKVE